MKSLAIITARGGSKRIPRKNIKSFLGIPIIAYSIEAALSSALFSEVMVSTDDDEIASIALQYGAKVPFMRSTLNSDDFSGTAEVCIEVLEAYQNIGKQFETACCIYPTAPFVTPQRLEEAHDLLTKKKYDSVLPILPFSFPIQRSLQMLANQKVEFNFPENLTKRSQDLPAAYHDAGQFYFFYTQALFNHKKLFTQNTGAILLKEIEAQDIDNLEDWEIAEFKYQFLHRNKK
jgi:N-acylneuraminate cytidylyltransferase